MAKKEVERTILDAKFKAYEDLNHKLETKEVYIYRGFED